MNTPFYESFDAEWPVGGLYRELLLVDSAQIGEILHTCRPPHAASTVIDPKVQGNDDVFFRRLLGLVGSADGGARYSRVLLIASTASFLESAGEIIKSTYPHLLRERRVFCSFWMPRAVELETVFRTIGAAQPVSPYEGSWFFPKAPW